MADLLANTLLYSRAHHLPQMLIGYAAATAIACWAGSGDIVLPAANSRGWSEMASVAATTIPSPPSQQVAFIVPWDHLNRRPPSDW